MIPSKKWIILLFCLLAGLQSCSEELNRLKKTNKCIGCDLSFEDFEGENLAGANLKGANLTGAVFFKANLTGANLLGAKIYRVNFAEVNLEDAIWIDGRKCKKGSIGTCVK
ncbi:MAG: pentapeptide repeat-containing protein [Deltaproteobacteria bacterium]|jgi:uncharacterized protein YjbI with pentapeptide repeats|nr:pentapeptide repeat-containing protein [Deltaproteobacteria bacterium]MBT4263433.1 pentapeptide repeat-containing protein [Deltaproteobacteria bacterium]MBT4638408.1 pentapeptide repeat-containing protein [Deltaproteobacteria bacterium]MBT6502126.1 pentapeptide repeat-containing protein [Deltaproteobacteria bacterium]MBT6615545.1 pentapeptide repeat-containing protein [Deltaproteobacteria bacterium]